MRIQTEEWRRFIPKVRMYQGKKTLFYNGEIIFDPENEEPLIYNWEERQTWKLVIVLPGVEVIPEDTFDECKNIETVIMSDDVRRIEDWAFYRCDSLVFVRLSRSLEFIGENSFWGCGSLTSMFIPPTCREIGDYAFSNCEKLIILSIPENAQLGDEIIDETELMKQFDWEVYVFDDIRHLLELLNDGFEDIEEWLDFPDRRPNSLHRICCSTNEDEAALISEQIYQVVKEQGPQALLVKNMIGVTALQYL
ncbi:leucine-rich repeat domain-containing protein [Chaetoceros tenuissimus]|uniref:Leucine-rich repeat domain-containing protein n=1 Tax=Chaetoceros tenuissimus TaxID=426638 RepID=A0AAD3HFH6_9STRA|nr:leucine-rich repeat domain-containing protein [Chaetoceros tenuissimus]